MIEEFEQALVEKYALYLVPEAKAIMFAAEESDLLQAEQVVKYPSVLVYREAHTPDLCQRYDYVEDTGESVTCYPFIQAYTFTVFLEKQSEALRTRASIRLKYAENPYNSFELDGVPVSIGLRLLSTDVVSERNNYSEKGAKRTVNFLFQSTLVVKKDFTVPVIKKVIIKIKPNGSKEAIAEYEVEESLVDRVKSVIKKIFK